MALTTEQMCYINNLLYAENPSLYAQGAQTSFEGKTVGELVSQLNPSKNNDGLITTEEWTRMKAEILADEQLCNLQIKDTYYDKSTGDAGCMFVDPSTNEAVIGFRGTGEYEWKDNFYAGSDMDKAGDPTISTQQQAALDYVEGLDLSGYDKVTVTGHSKGGNKAKLVALMNDEVDSCVSFDGQGFSDEFVEAHKDAIANNQYKIENHNVDNDPVNLLLNDFGETTYYEGQRVDGNFFKNHSPGSFFNDDGEMVVGEQTEAMQALDDYLNSALRSADAKQKDELLAFAGEIAQSIMGPGGSVDNAMEIIRDPQYADEMGYLVAFTLKYEQETGEVSDTVLDVLGEFGFEGFSDYVETFRDVVNNEMLFGIIKSAAKYGDDLPDWVLDKVLDITGWDMSRSDLRQILVVIANAAEYYDGVDVESDGDDIEVESTPPAGVGGSYVDGDEDFDSSGLTIFVHFAEMMDCCEQLQRAIEYYNEAIEMTRSAANELAGNWEGEAKEAFVADQDTALRWYMSLSEVASGVVRALKQNHSRYSNTVDKLADIMRG